MSRKWPIPMPPEAIVKDLPSAWTQEGEDVLEIRSGARERAERRRIERPTPRGEKSDACDTGPDLEPSRVEISVWNAVAREVESRPQQECREPRAAGRAGRSACRHVEGNDHRVLSSRMSAAASRRFGRLPVSCGGDSESPAFVLGVALAAAISAGVFAHASRHGSRHATAWGVAAFLFAGITVPVYFIRYWVRGRTQT